KQPNERSGEEMLVAPSTLGLGRPLPFPPHVDVNAFIPTPNCYWKLFNDLGLLPPRTNLEKPGISPKEFHNLIHQVQSLTGMMQMIIPLISQLAQQTPQPQALSLAAQPTSITLPQDPFSIKGSSVGGISHATSRSHENPPHDLTIIWRTGEAKYPDHNDALVISVKITNALVKRIMVDTRSSTDVLYLNAFEKLDRTEKDLNPMASTLTRFIGDSISSLGTTTLPITIGEEPISKTMMITFMVVVLGNHQSITYTAE
ncbi:hypothetical protein B296_00032836, partial [Ensete ventricosum]